MTNAAGHTTITDIDARWGQPTRVEDPNGLEVSISYDAFGRETSRDAFPHLPAASTPVVQQGYQWCNGNCNGGEYASTCVRDGAPTAAVDLHGLRMSVQRTRFSVFEGDLDPALLRKA